MANEHQINLRIVLQTPPTGIDYGLQKGSGNNYETVQTQRSEGHDLNFEFSARVKVADTGVPNFLGEYCHGTPSTRFVYIDIGTCAGQLDSPWTRRLKIPLTGITAEMISTLVNNPNTKLETHVPGIGRDGGPNCATVKPFEGWKIA